MVQNGLITARQLGVGDSLCYNNPSNQPFNSLCAIAPLEPSLAARPRPENLRVVQSYKIRENIVLRPSAGVYNLFNFANFDLPGNALNGELTGTAGQINGTTPRDHVKSILANVQA